VERFAHGGLYLEPFIIGLPEMVEKMDGIVHHQPQYDASDQNGGHVQRNIGDPMSPKIEMTGAMLATMLIKPIPIRPNSSNSWAINWRLSGTL
jgi:beta-glucosidase-like glycosyl hydrolase